MDGSLALGQAYAVVILGSESLVIHYEHAALTMPLRRAQSGYIMMTVWWRPSACFELMGMEKREALGFLIGFTVGKMQMRL